MRAINWRGILRLMFVRDWTWKLVSLVIACLLYFSINTQISHRRTLSVPVDVAFDSAGTGVVIESVEPRAVQVTLRGSYSALNQLNPEIMQFDTRPKRKKNNAAQADSETIKLSRFQLRNATSLRVVDIDPTRVLVKYDVPMDLTLGIARPEITGTARGQVSLSYGLTNAVVTGSRRLLATLAPSKAQVLSAPINVEGRTTSFQTRVSLYPPGDQTRLKVAPSDMVVNVHITSEMSSTRIEHVPVLIIAAATDTTPWVCAPSFVDLEVTGAEAEIARIRPGDFSVLADATHLDGDTAGDRIPLTVFARQGITVTAVTMPASVELTRPPSTNPE